MTESYKNSVSNLRYRRDVAIQALIKARRKKRKSSHLLAAVLVSVATLRQVTDQEMFAA